MVGPVNSLFEWAAVGALYAVLVAAAFYLNAADLTMMAALLIVPMVLVLVVRRGMPLLEKLKRSSPIAFAMPLLLCVIWIAQFPDRIPFFVLGGVCGMVYMVCFDVTVKLLWGKRDAG